MPIVEANIVPDGLIRLGLRLRLATELRQRYRADESQRQADREALVDRFRQSPIAIHTLKPNEQHYEVPAEFFQIVLGRHLKYSCCYWPEGINTLDEAEVAMLRLTCERAQLENGMEILELGCGWGSLCLWMAERYPNSRIAAVSYSSTQKAYIDGQCRARDLTNLDVITADVSMFQTDRRFDRVVSVEMFEHMKNYQKLLAKIAGFLKPGGKLFVHIFSHREFAYEFDAADPDDWMAQTFFTGGTMPSDDLLLAFQDDLKVIEHWIIDGTHYAKTLRAWLERLDRQKTEVRRVLAATYGVEQETLWLVNWRLFFMACEETFNFRSGHEYQVSHYLLEKVKKAALPTVSMGQADVG